MTGKFLSKREVKDMNTLKWLEKWYKSNCNGDWEHCYNNVIIKTMDNPGWLVDVNLIETILEDKPFKKIQINNNDNDWITCFVQDGKFKGRGDSEKLEKILEFFKEWAES